MLTADVLPEHSTQGCVARTQHQLMWLTTGGMLQTSTANSLQLLLVLLW